MDVVDAQIIVRHPGEAERVIPARDRLQHQAAGEQIRTDAAVTLRHRDAEVATLAEPGKCRRRPPFLAIHARGQRVELLARVLIGAGERLLLLRGQIERSGRRGGGFACAGVGGERRSAAR